jgi:hypothetical protein
MKKLLFCALLALTTGCTTTSYTVEDIETITPGFTAINLIPIATKDFVIVQPVYAQTTVDISDDIDGYTESTSVSGTTKDFYGKVEDRKGNVHTKGREYSGKAGEGERLRIFSTSGSHIIHRRLLDEAIKAGAHAIHNVHIESEIYCHKQAVTETKESHFDAQALLTAVSAVSSVAGNITAAAGGNATSQKVLNQTTSNAETLAQNAPSDIGTKETSEKSKLVCTKTYYGDALAIRYTDAIVPVYSR